MSKINVRSFSNENEDGAPDIVGVSTFSATSYFVPTRGTTAQRPSDHVEVGSLRYNYDIKNLEYYRGDTIGWSSFELVNPEWKHPYHIVHLDVHSGALVIPPNTYHRSVSGEGGSVVINQSTRDDLFRAETEFRPVSAAEDFTLYNILKGEKPVIHSVKR